MAAVETANIQNAILAYENTYGKLPISERISSGRPGDFTFGTSGTGTKRQVGNPAESYQANNSEVLAILMATTRLSVVSEIALPHWPDRIETSPWRHRPTPL